MTTDKKVSAGSSDERATPANFGGPKAHPMDERVQLPDGTLGTRQELLEWDRSR